MTPPGAPYAQTYSKVADWNAIPAELGRQQDSIKPKSDKSKPHATH